MPSELGSPVRPHDSITLHRLAATEMAQMAVEVILDKIDTPYTFPGVDEVSYGQTGWILQDAEAYLRRRAGRRSRIDVCVLESLKAARVAVEYAGRAKRSGVAADRARVWRAYEDAARWSRLARM